MGFAYSLIPNFQNPSVHLVLLYHCRALTFHALNEHEHERRRKTKRLSVSASFLSQRPRSSRLGRCFSLWLRRSHSSNSSTYILLFWSQISNLCCIYYQIHNWVLLFIGVIWKGDTLIDGVSHTLDMLRSKAYTLTLSFLSQIYDFLFSFFFFLILYIFSGQEVSVCHQ